MQLAGRSFNEEYSLRGRLFYSKYRKTIASRATSCSLNEGCPYSIIIFFFFAEKRLNEKKNFPEVLVVCFSIAIIVLIVVIVGCFVRFNMGKRKDRAKTKATENPGL